MSLSFLIVFILICIHLASLLLSFTLFLILFFLNTTPPCIYHLSSLLPSLSLYFSLLSFLPSSFLSFSLYSILLSFLSLSLFFTSFFPFLLLPFLLNTSLPIPLSLGFQWCFLSILKVTFICASISLNLSLIFSLSLSFSHH